MSVALMCVTADVGKATNASQNEKTLVFDDHPTIVQGFESLDVVLVGDYALEVNVYEISKSYVPLVFLAPLPLSFDVFRKGELIAYKQKGYIKTKYHAEHLFNPVKRC